MNGKTLIDWVDRQVVRQDFDRALALQCINSAQREIFKGRTLYKLFSRKLELVPVNGEVYCTTLKDPEIVEFHLDGEFVELEKVISFNQIRAQYKYVSMMDPYVVGVPKYYLINSDGLSIYPIPSDGYVSIMGEFFPEDLEDSTDSENVLTREMPDAIIFYAAATYFSVTTEYEKYQHFMERANAEINQYMAQSKAQRTSHVKYFIRDPWGDLPRDEGMVIRNHSDMAITRIDGGDWDVIIRQNGWW